MTSTPRYVGKLSAPRLARACAVLALLPAIVCGAKVVAAESLTEVIAANQPKIVKIYGAGGLRGLEPYQTGFLISDSGHILTVLSYVLDTDFIKATLDDGRKFEATLVNADPALEVAVLKIDASDLPYFDLQTTSAAEAGSRVLAFSNLFAVATGDEAASVQHGIVAVKTNLDGRRGTFETPYRGPVFVLDAMTNNPGAAGGALTNANGDLLGMLGKELRNAQNNIWLNYAIPIDELRDCVEGILAGKLRPGKDKPTIKPEEAMNLAALGLVLVPDVLDRTPPYVEVIRPGSPAARAGIRPDDLIVFVGSNLIHSCKALKEELTRIERDEVLKLVVMRKQELVEVVIPPPGAELSEK